MNGLSPGKKILFSALLALACLAAVELVFRFLPEPPRARNFRLIYNPELDFPRFYLKDKKLLWRLRPNQKIMSGFIVGGRYRTNSDGFRDREFSKSREPGKKRILCLGNSVTFGWRVTEEEAYPQVLQKLLGDKWEVYNCAQTGYTTFQGKRLLEELLEMYKPDAVSLAYIWNDLLPAAGGVSDSRQKLPPGLVLSCQNFLGRFAAYRWGRFLFLQLFPASPKTNGQRRVPIEQYRENLQAMLDGCRARHVRAFLVLPPAPKPEWLGIQQVRYQELFYGPFRQYAAELKRLADVDSVPLVESDSALSRNMGIWSGLPEDFIHPSAAAHREMAGMLASVLRRAGPE